jgi:hypothetical protein
MKSLLALALVVASASSAVAANDTEEAMMEGMKKCAVCKHLTDNPELMKNMTWETHKIDNGMLCVTTAPKEQRENFVNLNEKMHAEIEKVKADQKSGKEVQLCDMCADMGKLVEAGANEKEIQIPNGSIHMLTSSDPAVVAKIHANADKAISMQKQMAQK